MDGAVPSGHLQPDRGDRLGCVAERKRWAADTEEEVKGQGSGVHTGGEGDGEQCYPQAEQSAGGHDKRRAS